MGFLISIIFICFLLYFLQKLLNWYSLRAELRRLASDGEVEIYYHAMDDCRTTATIYLSEMRLREESTSAGEAARWKEYAISKIDGKWCLRLIDLYHVINREKVYRIRNGIIEDHEWLKQEDELPGGVRTIIEAMAKDQPFGDLSIQTKIQQAYDIRISSHSGRKTG